MMKHHFQEIADLMTIGMAERPRGFDLFVKEMASLFHRAFEEDTKTVYVSGYAFPMELLWAFDVIPFDFEIACNNLPAVGSGSGSSLMIHSENQGFSRDICSFDRLILGCLHQGILPKGDLYLTSTLYCNGKAKTNEFVASHGGKESILLDVPTKIMPSSIKYVAAQLKDIASRLEHITGKSLDMDKLKEAIHWSNRARSSLTEMNNLMKAKPFPYNGIKACLLGLGGALFWGSPIRDEINQLIIAEINQRIEQGASFPERHRILWYPWVPVQPTNIFSTLKENQVSVVMVEAARVWWSEMDEQDPFNALALKALENHHTGTVGKRMDALKTFAKEYQVDGVIHFATPACYHENLLFRIISDEMKSLDLPILNLEGDMSDERNYSPDQTLQKLLSFIDILDSKKAFSH